MVGRCALLIRVRDAKVASARVQQRCLWRLDVHAAPTIDALFSKTSAAYRNSDLVLSNFDPTYGYPTSISVDPSKQVKDDEWSFGVSSFRPRR